MPLGPDGRPLRSLRASLLALVLPPLVLLVAAGSLVAWNHWSTQARASEARLQQDAHSLIRAVDRELMLNQVTAQTLSHSSLIDAKDWPGFHRLAASVAASREGMLFALLDAQGRALANTGLPPDQPPPDLVSAQRRPAQWQGRPLPQSSLTWAQEALLRGRPVYSDLYFGVAVQRPALAVVVPVQRGGKSAFSLVCSFSPQGLTHVLDAEHPPGSLRAWLVDREGRLIAASGQGLETAGKVLPPALLSRLRALEDGVTTLRPDEPTLDGERTQRVAAAAVSPLTGWMLVVESSTDEAYAAARRLLGIWLAATLAVVALTAWVTARLARRLARPLLRLASSAMQPLQARRVQRYALQRPVQVREIAVLQQALQRADDTELMRQDEALQLMLARERERLARQSAEDWREREAQLRLALQAGRMGFWRLDLQQGELTSDSTHKQLWGLPVGSERLPLDLLLARVHADDLPVFLDQHRRAAAGEHLQMEFRVLVGDQVRCLHGEADLLTDEQGRPLAVLGVDMDITEQRGLREALQERTEALENADVQKNRFIAMLGHELRNPLAPIRTSADLLLHLAGDRADIAQAAERVQRQAAHLSRLIDDLLDIARITEGKLELRTEVLDLADVLREAVEAVRPLIDSRRHRLVLQGPPAPLYVRGDATRLLQVVANLLGNAAKYTGEGGKIRLTLARQGDEAVVTVEDNGPGLPADALPGLFDPFTQVRTTLHRAEGGLGIGLAVVRRLVELHGGHVEAHSDGPGLGARLRVFLPRLEAPASTAVPAPRGEAAPAGARRRVLLVDDNQDAADSLADLLALDGHEARVAYSAAGALTVVEAFTPDVAVLDIGLPDLDGCELAQQLRERLPALRLVALTGKAGDEEDRRMREAGFEARLVKPADLAALLALVVGDATGAA